MSNFCCLYPSIKLADAYDPADPFRPSYTVKQIREGLVGKVREMIGLAMLSKHEDRNRPADHRWYWAAPMLLDRADKALRTRLTFWLHDLESNGDVDSFHVATRKESKKKILHVAELRKALLQPKHLKLGRMPADLPVDPCRHRPRVTGRNCFPYTTADCSPLTRQD